MRTILLTLLVIYYNCLPIKCEDKTENSTEPSFELSVALSGHFPYLDGYIVGGTAVNITQVPYQISLQYWGQHKCGGSIIHRSFILTAAHCVDGLQPTSLYVRAGSTNIGSGGVLSRVCSVTQHERYKEISQDNYMVIIQDNDIALIQLCESLTFGNGIEMVRLPKQDEIFRAGLLATASGWGDTSEGAETTIGSLQQVKVPIIKRKKCNRFYRSAGLITITGNMICAGETKGGKDTCQGDSGGPLVSNGKLIGVVSWGFGCARPRLPGVYTKVSKYRNWIKNNANV